MRRRRNAAASSDLEATTTDSQDNTTDAAAAAAAPATPEEQAQPAPAPTGEAEADAPKTPRRRRSSPRKTADTPDAVVEVPAVAETVTPPAAEETPAAEAAPEKPKRAPRRRTPKKTGADAPPVEEESAPALLQEAARVEVIEAPQEITTVTPVAAEEQAADAPPPSDKPRRSRRRGGGGGKRAAADASTDTNAATAPGEAAAEPDATGETPLSARRTRGRQRVGRVDPNTIEEVQLPVPAILPPAAAAVTAAADEKPRRVRGVRTRPARALATPTTADPTTAAISAAPAAETLPPAYQPLPAETLARLAEAQVAVSRGYPELIVNGEPRLPLWFFVNTEMDPDARDTAVRQIRFAYEAGIRFFTLLAHLPWRSRAGERRFGPLDEILQIVADHAPDAFLMPRLIFSPPASWERAHPDEITRYADGETGDVSLASRVFWEGEAEEALRAAVEHVAEGPHAGRVVGFYLEHGEWFYEKGRGYDVSEANVQGFRAWLREHYRDNRIALRAAWHDGTVTFDTAGIPPAVGQPAPGAPLFFGDRERRYVDFHEYSSDLTAQVIARLGRAVKEASAGRSAVAVSYGYTLEMPRAHSGHLSLGALLNSPNIDILTGPVSYSGRVPGGSAPLPAPIESIVLAGKLWISEDDTKTFLAADDTGDTSNPKIGSAEATASVHARNFGAALAHGAGVSWMDLWGEGWLDERDLWQRGIGRLRDLADKLAARRRREPGTSAMPEPDVAVIVDERSFFDTRADEALLGRLVAQTRDALLRSGARIGFYLLSDLTKKNFPAGPRLLLFLNAFRLPEEVRAVIRERFQGDGRTLAWVYGPGTRETNTTELAEVVGMHLRPQPWGSKTGTQIIEGRSPLTEGLRGERLGEETRVNPSYYVVDPKAQVLGEYIGSGNPSLAVRKHENWQSVFIGEATLTLPLLRGLYRLAGVPVYTVDDDVALIGDRLICLHSAPGGGTTVYLPEEAVLYDFLSGETVASGGRGARLSVPPRGTRLLFYGTPAEVTAFGGDPKAGPPGLTESELPAVFVELPGSGGAPGAGVSAEDERLLAAALAAEFPLRDKDAEPEDEEDEAAETVEGGPSGAAAAAAAEEARKKKRRRRRRGGRGHSGEDGEDTAVGEGGTEVPAAAAVAPVTLPDDAAAPVTVPLTPSHQPQRTLPPLEELLPLSEALADDLSLSAVSAVSDDEDLAESVIDEDAATAPRRRSRRGGSGRSRRGEQAVAAPDAEANGTEADAGNDSPPVEAPTAPAPSSENDERA